MPSLNHGESTRVRPEFGLIQSLGVQMNTCHSCRIHHSCVCHSYCVVMAYLPWVRHQYLLHSSGTLILLTRVPHPHFLVMKFLHQRHILFCLVHVHSHMGYKNYHIFRDVIFYQFRCTRCFFSQSIEFRNGKYILKSDNTDKN